MKDCPKSCFCYGARYESPPLPWKDAFRNISLCVRFAYRLPSQGLSRLDVYVHIESGYQHKWSAQGYQGEVWKNGSIPIVRIKEKFKVCDVNHDLYNPCVVFTCEISMLANEYSHSSLCKFHPWNGYAITILTLSHWANPTDLISHFAFLLKSVTLTIVFFSFFD